MNIQPIVEGHGEIQAVPVLLRRLITEAGAYHIEVNSPIRARQSDLLNEERLRSRVALAKRQARCGAVLVLFEHEDGCPRELGPRLLSWARAEAVPLPCAVALAHREYEAWFLAAVESLRGKRGIRNDAVSPLAPEAVRDAKGALEGLMTAGRRYHPTVDQAAFSGVFSMRDAYARSRSFRHLIKSFGNLVTAMGESAAVWPPNDWLAPRT
jgi:hypothetical protein